MVLCERWLVYSYVARTKRPMPKRTKRLKTSYWTKQDKRCYGQKILQPKCPTRQNVQNVLQTKKLGEKRNSVKSCNSAQLSTFCRRIMFSSFFFKQFWGSVQLLMISLLISYSQKSLQLNFWQKLEELTFHWGQNFHLRWLISKLFSHC